LQNLQKFPPKLLCKIAELAKMNNDELQAIDMACDKIAELAKIPHDELQQADNGRAQCPAFFFCT